MMVLLVTMRRMMRMIGADDDDGDHDDESDHDNCHGQYVDHCGSYQNVMIIVMAVTR